jgi:phosphatidylserine decarboxylase
MIRYGSQVELVVPVTEDFEFELIQDTGVHVEAGVDPLIRIHEIFDEEDDGVEGSEEAEQLRE